MYMKRFAIGLLACCALLSVGAAEVERLTDLAKAQEKAKAENKWVLLDFTGSDWCVWCVKFDKEVMSSPEFREYAAKNLVLVEVDFPKKKKQSPALKQANEALARQYRTEDTFPTFILLNKDGKELGRLEGYPADGTKAFIAELEKWKKKG